MIPLWSKNLVLFISALFSAGLWSQPAATNAPQKGGGSENFQGIPVEDFVAGRRSLFNVAESTKSIQTDHFIVDIESKGGVLSSFKHRNMNDKLKDKIELITADNSFFRFEAYKSPASQSLFHNSEYVLSKVENNKTTQLLARLNVKAKTKRGLYPLIITKRYKFYKDLHYWEYDWEVENLSSQNMTIPELYFFGARPIGPKAGKEAPRAEVSFYNFYFAEDTLETIATESSGDGCFGESISGYINKNIDFFGTSSRFMVMAIQPIYQVKGMYVFREMREVHAQFKEIHIPRKKKTTLSFLVYTGPKVRELVRLDAKTQNDYPFLKNIHPKLYEAFNFGITGPIRDAIVSVLGLLYALVPNYGWGIIIFSILSKIVFFPLNQKQAESMKNMAKLQPKMKEINEKYKSNPQEKQRRTLLLYKENKVNPISGCLPILIQIPIFFALYAAFSDSYELWKSPFISGWIEDLSEPDTVYHFADDLPIIGGLNLNVLPLLMGVTQYLQSKFTMITTTDSSQQKIMQFLPLMLIFFFWNMPSGVILYWTVQNILSVVQQLYANAKNN